MKKNFLILLLIFFYIIICVKAQIDYMQNSVFAMDLNVPQGICFDTAANLFVANHSSDIYLSEVLNQDSIDQHANKIFEFSNVYEFPGPAGPINGPTGVCNGSTNIAYSVSEIQDATGYVWNLPAGVVLTSGANTASIIVDFTPTAVSGTISVYGTNNDGNGEPSNLSVTMRALPADIGDLYNNITNLNDSLIAYYPFDGDATDISGNNNHGTLYGPTPTTDRFGNPDAALNFEGLNNPQYIQVPNSQSLQFVDRASVSYWFRLNHFFGMDGWGQTSDYGVHAIFAKDFDACCFYNLILTDPSRLLYALSRSNGYPGDNELMYDTIPDADTAQWIHMAFVYTPTLVSMYVNGVLIDTVSGITTFANSNDKDLYFGRLSYNWYPLDGKLDDFRFYNRSLSAQEVACIYNGDCGGYALSAVLQNNKLCDGGNTKFEIHNAQSGILYQLYRDNQIYLDPLVGNNDTLEFSINNLHESFDFTILATDTLTGCSIMLDSTFTVQIIKPDAIASATLSSETVPSIVNLTSLSTNAESFEWFQDGISFSNLEQAQVVLENPGEYTFVLLAVSGPPLFCVDYDTVKVIVTDPIVINLLIPSSFTPNGDNINDNFTVLTEGITSYDIWIKDAWGILMTTFDQLSGQWNGLTTTGREAPSGPYYYHLNAVDYTNKSFDQDGTVYLIRDLIELAPNPVKQIVNISMKGRLSGNRIFRIISVQGDILLERTSSDEIVEMDVSQLKSGIYFMQINNNQDILNLKFIKE